MLSVRLNKFIDFKNLTSSQFADAAGVPRPTLSQLLTGRSKTINDVLLSKLHNAFPDLNISWLLFGEGEMTNDNIQLSVASGIANSSDLFPPEHTNQFGETPTANDEEPAPYGAPLPRHITSAARKEISKVVIFYTDNTFEEFGPR